MHQTRNCDSMHLFCLSLFCSSSLEDGRCQVNMVNPKSWNNSHDINAQLVIKKPWKHNTVVSSLLATIKPDWWSISIVVCLCSHLYTIMSRLPSFHSPTSTSPKFLWCQFRETETSEVVDDDRDKRKENKIRGNERIINMLTIFVAMVLIVDIIAVIVIIVKAWLIVNHVVSMTRNLLLDVSIEYCANHHSSFDRMGAHATVKLYKDGLDFCLSFKVCLTSTARAKAWKDSRWTAREKGVDSSVLSGAWLSN